MQDNEYQALSEQLLEKIEDLLEQTEGEIDFDRNGVVLTLEFDDGTEMVINKQAPMQEIWLASRLGAHHFSWQGSEWQDTRTQTEFFKLMKTVIKQLSGIELND